MVMPNLNPPITTVAKAKIYQQNILDALDNTSKIKPYHSIYLSNEVGAEEIYNIKNIDYILGAKLYPKGATTNSAAGISNLKDLYPHFKALEETDSVLQLHGEVTHTDIFDREKVFIEECLKPIVKNFPKLRIVLEHISSKEAVDFILASPDNVAATITPQHLLFNRNHMLAGGIKPHYYCLPILKRTKDQQALIAAACSGNRKFFAGSDSAPHAQNSKESSCGCAGVYSAPYAVSLYAEVFAKCDEMSKLNNFMSKYGAQFYNLPINSDSLELVNKPLVIPNFLPFGEDRVIPLAAGSTLQWSVANDI